MSSESGDETPKNMQTDGESQEYGAQHGQDVTGKDTGTSSPDPDQETQPRTDDERTGEGTGARAGEYG